MKPRLILAVDLDDLLLGFVDDLVLLFRDLHVGDRNGDGRLGGVLITEGLDLVEHFGRQGEAVDADTIVDDLAELLLADDKVDLQREHLVGGLTLLEAEVLRNGVVDDQAAHSRVDDAVLLLAVDLEFLPDLDWVVHIDQPLGVGHHGLVLGVVHLEDLARLDRAGLEGLPGVFADGADIDVVLFLDVALFFIFNRSDNTCRGSYPASER